jgi:hypothetical protein
VDIGVLPEILRMSYAIRESFVGGVGTAITLVVFASGFRTAGYPCDNGDCYCAAVVLGKTNTDCIESPDGECKTIDRECETYKIV